MFLESFSWQILIIGSCLLTMVSLTINKHQSHNGSSLQVLTSKYTGSLSAALIVWLTLSRQLPSNWWVFYLYGVAVSWSLILYVKAQRINMSQTSMAQPLGHILGIVAVAVFLSEWNLFVGFNTWKLWVALGLMGVFFWSFYEKDDHYSKEWLKLITTYLIAVAMYKMIIKLILNSAAPADILVFQYLGSLSGAFLGTQLRKQKWMASKKFAFKGWLQGLIGGSGIFLYYMAVSKSSMTQVTLVRAPLITLLSTLVGLIVFKEIKKMSKKKWFGLLVAGVITWLVSTH